MLVIIFQYIFLRNEYLNIFNSLLILLIVELISIPLLYEPLRILIKKVPFPITISIFILSIILGLVAEYIMLKNEVLIFPEYISLIVILGIVIIFGIFTYYPPKFFIFRDPVTKKYGDIR
jgi:hypothetical protein